MSAHLLEPVVEDAEEVLEVSGGVGKPKDCAARNFLV